MVRAYGDPLLISRYAEDGGEEAEMAAAYVVGRKVGLPHWG
jgi:hypothetical protein